MRQEKLYSSARAAKALGICVRTLYRWEAAGKITCLRTPSGHRRVTESEIRRLLGVKAAAGPRCAIYARVSTGKQEKDGNLERQKQRLIEAAREKGYEIAAVVAERSSGLNEKRKGLRRLLRLAMEGKIDAVLVEFRDRLARFGFAYLEEAFAARGTRIEVLEEKETPDAMQELVEDMLAVVSVFAARLYGARSKKFRQKVSMLVEEFAYGQSEARHQAGD